ncbi:GIY-YIG nuclease family protein [Cytophaga aurantiaca]|uniref:GIY-YIG nuclease family protein n=1 Tax=Cytophaga aurantiaca TaxID=29530 RepID=UPI00047784FF
MASVYILFSDSLGKYYIGSCKDIDDRLQQHRLKVYNTSFTSKAEDWQVFLLISVPIAIGMGYEQARKIEGHIKRMKSSVYIKNLKQYPEIIEKLIQIYS